MAQTKILKHKAIENELRRLVAKAEDRQDKRLPSEAELMAQFCCSRGSVRRAMGTLVSEGVVACRRGAGAFVQDRKRADIVGLIVPNIINPDHAALAQALSEAATARGHAVIITAVESEHPDRTEAIRSEHEFIERMIRMNTVGVVKCPIKLEFEEEMRGQLRAAGVPYVVINDFWSDCHNDHHVTVDEREAVGMAIEHLVSLGHEDIVFLTTDDDPRPKAIEAFERVMTQRGLQRETKQVLIVPRAEVVGQKTNDKGQWKGITAIIAPYYKQVQYVLDSLEQLGIRVPQDISVISLGGQPQSGPHRDVTSMVFPFDQIAAQALKLLLDGSEASTYHICFMPKLHLGKTTTFPQHKTAEATTMADAAVLVQPLAKQASSATYSGQFAHSEKEGLR